MKKTISTYFKALFLFGALASITVLTSCSEDDSPPAATETIWEILSGADNLGSLEAELSAFASLETTLSSETGTSTLFAPTDAALSTLLGTLGLESFSSVSPTIAEAVLSFHVSSSLIEVADLTEGETFAMLQGESFTVGAGSVIVSGATANATVVETIQATNGVIHIIDVVMVPPTIGASIVATLGTLAQPILLGADFTTLAAGIAKADATATDATATIVALLTAGTDLTVFAPTNATFAAASLTVDSFTAAQWDGIIRNHIVAGQGGGTDDDSDTLGSDDLTTGAVYTTAAQGELTFFFNTTAIPADNGIGVYIDANGDVDLADTGTYTNFDAEVAVIDAVSSSNGRIHVIAGVLSPL
ncbi:MAG: fasciclin domain-containing protein [Cyclobacteriaceae bacterium]